MASLAWDCVRTDGVTLVSLFITSEWECRVRVANRLDGPVWPPRRRGQPAAGWADGEFAGVVPADGRLVVGYATSARPADPPAELVATGPPDADEPDRTCRDCDGLADERERETAAPAVEETPAGVVRSLGDPVVPRDCVSLPEQTEQSRRTGHSADPRRADDRRGRERHTAEREPAESVPVDRSSESRPRPLEPPSDDALLVPGTVRAWLRDVERRRDADGVAQTADLTDAAAVDLTDAAAVDRRALAWVERRIDAVTRSDRGQNVATDGEI